MTTVPTTATLSGTVVYFYAFDIAHEMRRGAVEWLLGQKVEVFTTEPDRRRPRQAFFHRPQMVRLPATQRDGPFGRVEVGCTVKFLPIGAVSVAFSVPFSGIPLERLVDFHDLRFPDATLHEQARALATKVQEELRQHLVRPNPTIGEEDAYTVFCVHLTELGDGSAAWLEANRRNVAGLLTDEREVAALSDQNVADSTSRSLSYYRSDLVVADWNAALVIDNPRNLPEILHVLELANLQLAELEAYDAILDEVVERSYRDLGHRFSLKRRGTIGTIAKLRELRIDLARLSDELLNITKFLGDWHISRVYNLVASRFHLGDWHRRIDDKLKTLDDLYQDHKHDQNSFSMLILEITIVILFLLDIAFLLL